MNLTATPPAPSKLAVAARSFSASACFFQYSLAMMPSSLSAWICFLAASKNAATPLRRSRVFAVSSFVMGTYSPPAWMRPDSLAAASASFLRAGQSAANLQYAQLEGFGVQVSGVAVFATPMYVFARSAAALMSTVVSTADLAPPRRATNRTFQ